MKKLPFDKVYCLHCIEHEERFEHIKAEFEKVGILNEVEFRTTCLHPKLNLISDGNKLRKLNTENEYHCAREHYTMIKIAYLSGCQNVLIFEDDIYFTNPDLFLEYANNLPEDYDILMFGYSLFGKNGLVYLKGDDRWCKTKLATWGTFAYAMSRSGMEKYLKRLEEEYCVADMPLADSRNAIKYLPNVKLIEHVGFKSSIR